MACVGSVDLVVVVVVVDVVGIVTRLKSHKASVMMSHTRVPPVLINVCVGIAVASSTMVLGDMSDSITVFGDMSGSINAWASEPPLLLASCGEVLPSSIQQICFCPVTTMFSGR